MEVELLADVEGERFYRMVWTERAQIIGYIVAELGATVQKATASDGEWHLRVFFPERRGLSAINEYVSENELALDVTRICGIGELEEARHNLSKGQYEALTTGIEQGYYDIPHKINAQELPNSTQVQMYVAV